MLAVWCRPLRPAHGVERNTHNQVYDTVELFPGMDIQHLSRDQLFSFSRTDEVKLIIATADKRPFSCIVLTLGARKLA